MANDKQDVRRACKVCGLRIYFDNDRNFFKWRHHGSNFAENYYPITHLAEPVSEAKADD